MIEDAEHAALLAQPVVAEVEAGLARRVWSDGRVLAHHCFGAGAKGAGGGTFLLIKASSFCLSVVELLAPAVESVFFGAAGAGVVATGGSPAALGFDAAVSSAAAGVSSLVAALARDLIQLSMVAAASSGS